MAKWSDEKMADLTRKLADTAIEQNELYQAALRDAKEAEAYAKELEAKLAKAVEGFEKLARLGNGDRYGNSEGNVIAQSYIAELTGGKDE